MAQSPCNTTAPGIILVVNKRKAKPGEFIVINATKLFCKGRPKNFLTPDHVSKVAESFRSWKNEEALSAVITESVARNNDFNLSPSRYVNIGDDSSVLPLEEAVLLLQEAEEERAEVDTRLDELLVSLGFEGWRNV